MMSLRPATPRDTATLAAIGSRPGYEGDCKTSDHLGYD